MKNGRVCGFAKIGEQDVDGDGRSVARFNSISWPANQPATTVPACPLPPPYWFLNLYTFFIYSLTNRHPLCSFFSLTLSAPSRRILRVEAKSYRIIVSTRKEAACQIRRQILEKLLQLFKGRPSTQLGFSGQEFSWAPKLLLGTTTSYPPGEWFAFNLLKLIPKIWKIGIFPRNEKFELKTLPAAVLLLQRRWRQMMSESRMLY